MNRDRPEYSAPVDVTAVLQSISSGRREDVDRLFDVVYSELRRIAHVRRLEWHGAETINTTALVHEAYLKLVRQEVVDWRDRAHFFAVASTAMRHILINYAERRLAARRGGGAPHVALDDANPVADDAAEELLALHHALEQLEKVHERQGRVVECRFFGGLAIHETAVALGVSRATIERDWALASAWLRRALGGSAGASA